MSNWPDLPIEIRLTVLKFVADSKLDYEPESRRKEPRTESSLAALATVCREWQDHFEAITFHRLTLMLDSGDFQKLSSIVSGTHRQSLVRHLALWIDESTSPILAESREKTRTRRNLLTKSITWLFLCLSKWQSSPHPGLTLELCASDIQPTDIFAGWDWSRLPSAPVVTALILPRRKTPWMDGDQFRYLFAAIPSLQSFRWEPWQHHFGTRQFEPVSGIWFKRERSDEIGFAILKSMSSTVKSVSMFSEGLCSALNGNNTAPNSSSSREPEHWTTDSLRWIAEALTRRGTQLTHLAACYIIDASTFLDMALRGPLHVTPVVWSHMLPSSHHRELPDYSHWNSNPFRPPPSSPHPTWQQLETLTLTSRLLNPSRKDEIIDGLFLKAGQLAKRSMPKLRTMEIWNGTNPSDTREGFGFIFRYRRDHKNSSPWRSDGQSPASLLEFKSSWHFAPSRDVLAAWEDVAAAQHQRLEVSVEHVQGEGLKSGLAVMEQLVTRGLVVSGRTWDEIRREGRTGRTAPVAGFD